MCAYSFGRTSTAFDIPNECCLAVTHVPKSYWRMLYNRHRDADVVKFDLIARTLFLHCLRRLLGMATKLERSLVHKADQSSMHTRTCVLTQHAPGSTLGLSVDHDLREDHDHDLRPNLRDDTTHQIYVQTRHTSVIKYTLISSIIVLNL